MDIYFAGTPNSAAEILKSLASNALFNIKGVITQPDKKGKRGNKLVESPVSLMANSLNLHTYKPHNLTKEHLQNDIDINNADILLVVAYGKLIPNWILKSNIKAIKAAASNYDNFASFDNVISFQLPLRLLLT